MSSNDPKREHQKPDVHADHRASDAATLPPSDYRAGRTVVPPTPSAEDVAYVSGHVAVDAFVETAAYLRRLVELDVPGLVQKSSHAFELLEACERELHTVRRERDNESRKCIDASRLHGTLAHQVRELRRRAVFIVAVSLAGGFALGVTLGALLIR